MRRVLLLLTTALLQAHGFHSSLATVDYITETQALQAIVVVNAGDLETLLRRDTGRQIELDRTKDAQSLIAAYLSRTLQLKQAGKQVPLHWVGMEVKTNFVYLYAEAKLPNLDHLEISNTLLQDLLPDQVNMLSLRRDSKGKPFDQLFQQGTNFTEVKW